MVSRARDWFRQALRDLEHARRSLEFGDYEWACFAAHQAAEKAVKALYQCLGVEAWGHSVSRLLAGLPAHVRPPDDLVDAAKGLDKFYIPSRYPNAHPEGAPMDYFTRGDAEGAVSAAERIVRYVGEALQTRCGEGV
ncbi:HEPN domain-containing protein [Thermoproteus tenax]|uniref:HEPN domain containing protein n=1 Tax=Thermoproteus tenax (strain ATCC 35583 / DSM 2078 / JCM 9277 / NBRC 100435 / Kra 1) TaxID=768679 RepID=G4RK49_THETK|nr:HEPN domain-containing protein [Thermoproteus tenax]CCC81944.1 HEPN domain containing protein [Thermoproteus tenax Kra 1]